MKVSLIIAHINATEDLKLTIESHVEALKGFDYEIIVCDNGSAPEDLEHLSGVLHERQDTVLLFEHVKGTVAPFQKAASRARGEYLCISDQHVRVAPDFYQQQLEILDNNPTIGTLYAKCYFSLDKLDDFSYHYNWGYTGNWKGSFTVNPPSPEPYPTLVSQMGSALVRRELFEKYGQFSKSCFNKFGGYTAEELLLGLKTWMWGYQVYMNPKTFYRHMSVSTGHERGPIKNQPEAMATAAYLLGGESWLDRVARAWEGRLYGGGDSPYETLEAAKTDIIKDTDPDRRWLLEHQKYSFDEIIDKYEKETLWTSDPIIN